MTNSSELLTHTADVRLRVSSDSLPGLFELSLKGLNQLLVRNFNQSTAKERISESISIVSPDTTSLLIDFLSEVLTLCHLRKSIFYEFSIGNMSDCTLSAVLHGAKVDAFDKDVKAVTYHEANVHINSHGDWETIIIFDI
ncbi:MAG: archease [Balneolaceae bacterium]